MRVKRDVLRGHVVRPASEPDGFERLALAVLALAVRDSFVDPAALAWLRSAGDELVGMVGWPTGVMAGFDPGKMDRRVLYLPRPIPRGAVKRGAATCCNIKKGAGCCNGAT